MPIKRISIILLFLINLLNLINSVLLMTSWFISHFFYIPIGVKVPKIHNILYCSSCTSLIISSHITLNCIGNTHSQLQLTCYAFNTSFWPPRSLLHIIKIPLFRFWLTHFQSISLLNHVTYHLSLFTISTLVCCKQTILPLLNN